MAAPFHFAYLRWIMNKNRASECLKLFWVFFKIGLFTFGGGLAMISLISREVAESRKWLTEKEMGDIVIIAESTPGPIAVNTATYVGYKVGGVFGSVMATLGVVLPSLVIITLIYFFFEAFKANRWFGAAFRGIRAAVIVLLFGAFVKLFRPMEKNAVTLSVAAAVFLVMLFTNIDSVYLIIAGGVLGILYFTLFAARLKKKKTGSGEETGDNASETHENGEGEGKA